MNFTINTQKLAVELRLLNKVVPQKPTIAVLGYIRIVADGDKIGLYATDLDIGLTTTCDAEVSLHGTALMPSSRLLAMIEQLPDADVSFTVGANTVSVACASFKSKLQTLNAADYPPPPEVEGVTSIVDGASLCDMVRKTRYAINAVSQKHVLQGAQLNLTEGAASMVATDGKRLAIAAVAREAGPNQQFIVPAKALDWISTLAGGSVDVTLGLRHCAFEAGGRILNARLLAGEFPKYERIIPRDNANVATVGVHALAAALRRVLLVSEENQAVYLTLAPNVVSLRAAASGIGTAEDEVPIVYAGQPMQVCVNGTYLLDFLEAAAGHEITLAFKDAKGSVLLTDGASHVGVVMLMRA